MFKRLVLEEWQTVIPIIAFAFTFIVFLYFVVRAILLKQPQIQHLSHLPLEKDETQSPH